MTEPGKHDRKRRFFDGLAVVTLIGFAIFTLAITLGAVFLPRLKERDRRRAELGPTAPSFRRTSFTCFDLRFSPDDSEIRWRRAETWVGPDGPGGARRRETEASHPTGRRTEKPVPGHPRREEILRDLLALPGWIAPMSGYPSVSRDGREMAFLSARAEGGDSVVHRDSLGTYRDVSGSRLPEDLARLAGRPRPLLAERLSSPDPREWVDAAVESVLQDGVRASVFVDRLLARPGSEDAERDLALRWTVRLAREGEIDEAARLVALADEATQREAIDRLTRGGVEVLSGDPEVSPGEAAPVDPARLLEALLKRDWGERPRTLLKSWLLRPLEEGWLLKLDPASRPALAHRLRRFADREWASRLAAVIEGPHPMEASAAARALQAVAGEAEDGGGAPLSLDAARTVLAGLRERQPDLFR